MIAKENKNLIQDNLFRNFYFFKKGTNYFILNTDNLSLFKIDSLAYQIFLKIKKGNKIEDVLEKYKIENFAETTEIFFKGKNDSLKSSFTGESKNILDRLVLNVSNDCNLSCRYCYATNGTYNQDKSLMEERVAIKAIDYFYNVYDEVNTIQFFGGEPLLNPEIMEKVCRYTRGKFNKHEILKLPVFAVVTNGTIISPKILEILSAYDIRMTISLDGPEFIHDYLRGNGTFKKIINNLQVLKSKNIDFGVECTLTNYHLVNNVDISNLMDFFYKEMGLHLSHIPYVAVAKENPLYINKNNLTKAYTNAIESSLMNLKKKDYKLESYTLRLLRAIIFKKSIEVYCSAGITTLSVSCKGDIYPCFMFTGNKEYLIGNIFENNISSTRVSEVKKILEQKGKCKIKCNNCWAKSLCFGCIGHDVISGSGTKENHCDFNKAIIKFFLLNCYDILNDPVAVSRIMNIAGSIEK
jgi:uncharacterized protein